jgi:(p)ppGpp synthase/HD superfamily hydrolase
VEREEILRALARARTERELVSAIRRALAYAQTHRDETMRLAVEPFIMMALGMGIDTAELGLRETRDDA